jgi:hypothetical protein
MPSTISAGTTAGTALNFVSDTTGNLAFQTNGSTTAMTIDTSQNVTFANNVTYTGTITATSFSGNGAGLTAINASNVASGTLAVARGGTGLTTLTANNVLIGNGTGNVAFVAPGSNGNVLTSNGAAWVSSASSVTRSQLPAGSVLQVVSATKTDTFSTSSASDVIITGITVSITPTSTSSKILVIASISVCVADTANGRFNLYRAGSAITGYRGNAAGSRVPSSNSFRGLSDGQNAYNAFSLVNMNYLDSPSTTSSTDYAVYVQTNGTIWVNRTNADPDTGDGARTASTITVMEIAA